VPRTTPLHTACLFARLSRVRARGRPDGAKQPDASPQSNPTAERRPSALGPESKRDELCARSGRDVDRSNVPPSTRGMASPSGAEVLRETLEGLIPDAVPNALPLIARAFASYHEACCPKASATGGRSHVCCLCSLPTRSASSRPKTRERLPVSSTRHWTRGFSTEGDTTRVRSSITTPDDRPSLRRSFVDLHSCSHVLGDRFDRRS
jgi:hypothetical protein